MIPPQEVRSAAKKREKENLRFRTFLKNHADEDTLDQQFLELHRELFANYDCCKCANCCREYSTTVTEAEAAHIAAGLKMTVQEFETACLSPGEEGPELRAPCVFLQDDGKCRIQDCKPQACREFPYTDKPGRVWSLYGVIEFAEICPVAFEILERLKKLYRFR